jgi:sugar/nucleoside kinase (ribokinase family)
MVVVGHAGFATVHTTSAERTSPGGSGYAVAASAAALIGDRVGLVAQVGGDFDLAPLEDLGVNLDGVEELLGTSATLHIDQFDDGTRSFGANLGVAATIHPESFPDSYLGASYIHLGTAPPGQQLIWLRFLYDHGSKALISADMFEHYVDRYPAESREVCDSASLLFMNEAEYDGLYGNGQSSAPKAPLILKRGSWGASIVTDGLPRDVYVPEADAQAPEAHVIDPTGGGEILAAVFLALRVRGLKEIDALRYAVRAAAACVEDFGVTSPRLSKALADIRSEVLHLPTSRSTGQQPPGL